MKFVYFLTLLATASLASPAVLSFPLSDPQHYSKSSSKIPEWVRERFDIPVPSQFPYRVL